MYPPGDYTFKITGTLGVGVGAMTDSIHFTLKLIDPCSIAALPLVGDDNIVELDPTGIEYEISFDEFVVT